jgi:hypothetical protein
MMSTPANSKKNANPWAWSATATLGAIVAARVTVGHTLHRLVRRLGPAERLVTDTRGALTAEYIVAVGLVSVGALFAMVHYGPIFVDNYERSRNAMLVPAP